MAASVVSIFREWLTWIIILTAWWYTYGKLEVSKSVDSVIAEDRQVNEGDSVTLPCEFTPPDAYVGSWYWNVNNTLIVQSTSPSTNTDRYQLSVTHRGNISLAIQSVSRWDAGAYECGVDDNSQGTLIPFSDVCVLTVNYLDDPSLQLLPDNVVSVSSHVSMNCSAPASATQYDNVALTFFHENQEIDVESQHYRVISGANHVILKILEFGEIDEGAYACRAENRFFVGEKGKLSHTVVIHLESGPSSSLSPPPALSSSPPSSSPPPSSPPSSSAQGAWAFLAYICVLIIAAAVSFYIRRCVKGGRESNDRNIVYNMPRPIWSKCKKDDDTTGMVAGKYDTHRMQRKMKHLPIGIVSKEEIPPVEKLSFDTQQMAVRGHSFAVKFTSNYKETDIVYRTDDTDRVSFSMELAYNQSVYFVLLKTDIIMDKKYKSELHVTDALRTISLRMSLLNDKVQKGVEGTVEWKCVNEYDEGQYLIKLMINRCTRTSEVKPIVTYYGKVCIEMSNVILRSYDQIVYRPIVMLNTDRLYLFCEVQVGDGLNCIISCPGTIQSEGMSVLWDTDAKVLIHDLQDRSVESFVALPNITNDGYVFMYNVNVSQSQYSTKKDWHLIVCRPNESSLNLYKVLDELAPKGTIFHFKLDPMSGIKLSNDRLVVCGVVKRIIQETNVARRKTLERDTTSFERVDTSDDQQQFECVVFVIWMESNHTWEFVEITTMENHQIYDNIRIQLSETSAGHVYVNVFSTETRVVSYRGISSDYCTSFESVVFQQYGDVKIPILSCPATLRESPAGGNAASWHILLDPKQKNNMIRLGLVKDIHDTTNIKFVNILENKDKVECLQIVPFQNIDQRDTFIMVYTSNKGLCTRYHIFTFDELKPV